MNKATQCTMLVSLLCEPSTAASLSLSQWDLILRQARESGLLSRLAYELQKQDFAGVPEQMLMHLESAITYAERQRQVVQWEVRCISEALEMNNVPIVLLKGAAYVVANLPAARGRIFSDIDIIVPKKHLGSVEQGLFAAGWVTTHLNAYDQRYYREWMHELPPMQHHQRRSVLDVHHNILPETARAHPNANLLLADIQLIDEKRNLYVLSPVDMIIHSATHLFFDGEFEHGLRDLLDMHDLINHFADDADFWPRLVSRARALTLQRPLYYALTHVKHLYDTAVPDEMIAGLQVAFPNRAVPATMNAVFRQALVPPHSSCQGLTTSLAQWFLYIRAHYLRMPLHLLLPHLTRKAFRSDDK